MRIRFLGVIQLLIPSWSCHILGLVPRPLAATALPSCSGMRTLFGFVGRTPDPPRRQQSGTSTPEQPRRLRSSPRASSLSVVITEPPPQWERAQCIGLTAYEALARLAGQISKERKAGSVSALQATASEACDEEEANRPPKGSTLSDDDDRTSSPEDAARFTWTGEPRWTGPRAEPFPSGAEVPPRERQRGGDPHGRESRQGRQGSQPAPPSIGPTVIIAVSESSGGASLPEARAEVALLQRLIPGEVHAEHPNPFAPLSRLASVI